MNNSKGKEHVQEVSRTIADAILQAEQPDGMSISDYFDKIYKPQGYEWIYKGPYIGWVASKDGGETELIMDSELFEVLEQVKKLLRKEGVRLDFSQWKDMVVGLPYNLEFVVRRKKN